jgi:NAD(P)H-hydrate epimerase
MTNYIKNIHTDFLTIDIPQMIEVDRLMMNEYGIELIQMMENAGRCLAILTKDRFFNGNVEGKNIVILVGTGGNGGGALVAARRLHIWGANISVFSTADYEKFTPVPKHQLDILTKMGVIVKMANELPETGKIDAILDGIIGYSLNGNPFGHAADMIKWANLNQIPTVSLDTPSGLDLTFGKLYDPIIKASATLTLAIPKIGLINAMAKKVIGELYLGDISVPLELYKEKTLNLSPTNVFKYSDVVRIY